VRVEEDGGGFMAISMLRYVRCLGHTSSLYCSLLVTLCQVLTIAPHPRTHNPHDSKLWGARHTSRLVLIQSSAEE
jgi:hypothetical protein